MTEKDFLGRRPGDEPGLMGERRSDSATRRKVDRVLGWLTWSQVIQWAVLVAVTIAIGTLISANTDRINDINHERERNLRVACESQNARHDATVQKLDDLLAQARVTASPEKVKRIEASRASTVALIDALAPLQDCEALVNASIQHGSP
jgi:hypothetical protein